MDKFSVWQFFISTFVLLIYILDDCRFKAAESCVKNISKWKIFLAIIVIWGIAYLAMFPEFMIMIQ